MESCGTAAEPDFKLQARTQPWCIPQPDGPPTDTQLQQIVGLETMLFTAQSENTDFGWRPHRAGREGRGPTFLSILPFSTGGWNQGISRLILMCHSLLRLGQRGRHERGASQQSVARGEMLFHSLPLDFSNVAGLNDVQGQAQIVGTCTTCHNTPNVGGNSSFS